MAKKEGEGKKRKHDFERKQFVFVILCVYYFFYFFLIEQSPPFFFFLTSKRKEPFSDALGGFWSVLALEGPCKGK